MASFFHQNILEIGLSKDQEFQTQIFFASRYITCKAFKNSQAAEKWPVFSSKYLRNRKDAETQIFFASLRSALMIRYDILKADRRPKNGQFFRQNILETGLPKDKETQISFASLLLVRMI